MFSCSPIDRIVIDLVNLSRPIQANRDPQIPAICIPATLSGGPPPSNASLGVQWKREAAYIGDLRQHAPRRFISQVYAANNVSSWSYRFNVLTNGQLPTMGSTHFQEVAFVFHNLEGMGYNNSVAVDPFENKPQSYDRLATIMSRMWVSFIVDGDPNMNNGKFSFVVYGCI